MVPVPGLVWPVQTKVSVGAAHDPAEVEADRVARSVLDVLRRTNGIQRVAAPPPLRPVPYALRRMSQRSAIGREGGDLDAGSAASLHSATGCGRPIPGPLRTRLEPAMGADLSGIRLHTDDRANELNRSMSALAFTHGPDIFFRDGMPDTGAESGMGLLVHELAHTVQQSESVRREVTGILTKSDDTKQKTSAAAAKKKALLDARAAMKAADARARLEAKAGNKSNKKHSERIGSGYTAGDAKAKVEKTDDHKATEQQFQAMLDRERQARIAARQRITSQVGTQDQEDEAQLAEEEAADLVWVHASEKIRAFRPLRFDDFDKALMEVRELRLQDASDEQGEVASFMQANEKAHGVPLKPEKALKKVKKIRSVDHSATRAAESKGEDPAEAAAADTKAAQDKATSKLAALAQERPVHAGERARVEGKSERKLREEKYLPNSKVEDAATYFGDAGSAITGAGKATKLGTKGVVNGGVGGATENSGSEISELVGTSTSGLGQVFNLISDILSLASTIQDIRRGTADRDAKLVATQKAVGVTTSAAALTKNALIAAKEGVASFGGVGTVVNEAGSAIPIVGLVISVLGVIDGALELIPVSTRLGTGLQSLDEAVLAGKAPLAASIGRINRRNVQQVEKAGFDIAKSSTMVGLHIAEIASAGGFGIPFAAKLTVAVTGLAHSLGHTIYDTVNESQSATAKKQHEVKHEEGASRDLLKYDIGTSVDVLIVAAQKHKLTYARTILLDYGVTATEIQTMRMQELREKVLDGLDAEGDPKTVTEKIDEAKDSVNETLGVKKKPTGIKSAKEEKTGFDKLLAKPAAAAGGLTTLGGKVGDKFTDMANKHKDAKQLVAAKNSIDYDGNHKRGRGAVLEHMIRDPKKIEKSFAKVRGDLAGDGVPTEFLPRTSKDMKKREKIGKAKDVGQSESTDSAQQIDLTYIAKVATASEVELADMLKAIDANDPTQIGNVQFLEYEVQRRLAAAKTKTKTKTKK